MFDANTTQFLRTIKHDISVASSLNSNSIGATLSDKSGLFWIGTWGGGLNLFNPFNNAFRTLRHSPTDKNSISVSDVLSVMSTQSNDVWVGTRGNGIDVLRPGEGLVNHFAPNPNDVNSLQDGLITAFFQTQKGDIWVGSRVTGAYRFRPETNDFQHYTTENGLSSNVIKRIVEDRSGNLWIGTGKGLDRFDQNADRFTTIGIKNTPTEAIGSHLNALAVTNDGSLYAGASNGLYRLQAGGKYLQKTVHTKANPKSLSHNMVLGLFVDDQQTIWASTSHGLDKLINWNGEETEFESINSRVGYPNQALWGNLQYDQQGRIWDGKNIIDISNNRVRELSKADGVDFGVNWYAGYHKTSSGTLLYAGSKGLLMIKPELFQEWNYQPPVIITKLLIDNEPVDAISLKQVELSPEVKSFRVEFSSLDYSSPESLQYAFRLQGYDDWRYVDSTQRAVSYTNLSPRNYTLEIKATNRNGAWSERQISLPVIVLPAWYQKAWFQLAIALGFAGILYILYFLRVRKLHEDKKVLENQVDLRTQELEKSNLSVRTLSDIGLEISSTLNLDKILNTVYERVNQLMDANVFWIGFYEESERQIVFKLAIEKGKHLPQFSVSMDDASRYAVWCVTNRKPIVINDKERDRPKYVGDAPKIKPVAGEETASIIYWPLEAAGKIIGTISVQSFEPDAYNERHLDIIKTLASTTAIVMDNANAYEKAQRAAEVKSAFMANMSHEIRTPMNGILGMTRLIKETTLDSNQKQYIENIDTSAKTLLTIINDILDFSKVESGKLTLEQSPFSLTWLIKNVTVVVETLANEKGLNFNYQICRETPADFIGDPTRINQILLNLCSNAVKFTEKGEVCLLITSIPLENDEYTLKIDVIDQGIGIEEKAIPKLFSSFSQADTSTTRKYGGTGLGLVISQQLAHKMNGNIKVKSIPKVGSCFSLSMRLQVATTTNSKYVEKTRLNRKANVLVIDKDEINKRNIERELDHVLG
ncbi:MAG: ATP-binding protein, partial [Kangiellaceae bacterium]|nr:ATP-binding protein [Kangiellaceae bacterium]